MKQNIAPLLAAQTMLANRVDDDTIVNDLRKTFHLDTIDAKAAVAAARVLSRL